jgi:hypothetical protein
MTRKILYNEWRRMRASILWTAAATTLLLAYASWQWLPPADCEMELAGMAIGLTFTWTVLLFRSFGSDAEEAAFLNGLPLAPGQIFRTRLMFRLAVLAAVTAIIWFVTEYPSNVRPLPVTLEAADWIAGGVLLCLALSAGLLLCVSSIPDGARKLLPVLFAGIPLILFSQLPAAAVFAVFSLNGFINMVALQVFCLLTFTGSRLWKARGTASSYGRALRLPLAFMLALPWLEFAAGSLYLQHQLNTRLRAAAESGTHLIPPEWADALNGLPSPANYEQIIAGLTDNPDSGKRRYLWREFQKLNFHLADKAEKQLAAGHYRDLLDTLRVKFSLFNWNNEIIFRCMEDNRAEAGFFRELLSLLIHSHHQRIPSELHASFHYRKLRPLQDVFHAGQPVSQVKLNRSFLLRPLRMSLQCGELDELATFRRLNIDQSSSKKELLFSGNAKLEQLEALVRIRLYQLENGVFPDEPPEDIRKLMHGMTYRKTPSGFRAESTRYNYFAAEYRRQADQ